MYAPTGANSSVVYIQEQYQKVNFSFMHCFVGPTNTVKDMPVPSVSILHCFGNCLNGCSNKHLGFLMDISILCSLTQLYFLDLWSSVLLFICML